MVCEDGVADGDVPRYALIKAAVGKYPESCSKVLLAIQSLIFEIGEFGILSDPELLP